MIFPVICKFLQDCMSASFVVTLYEDILGDHICMILIRTPIIKNVIGFPALSRARFRTYAGTDSPLVLTNNSAPKY